MRHLILLVALLGATGHAEDLEHFKVNTKSSRVSCNAACRFERVEDQIKALKTQLEALGAILGDQHRDREQAIDNNRCTNRCDDQFGTWREHEQKSVSEARTECYRECSKSHPMPAGLIGGGC